MHPPPAPLTLSRSNLVALYHFFLRNYRRLLSNSRRNVSWLLSAACAVVITVLIILRPEKKNCRFRSSGSSMNIYHLLPDFMGPTITLWQNLFIENSFQTKRAASYFVPSDIYILYHAIFDILWDRWGENPGYIPIFVYFITLITSSTADQQRLSASIQHYIFFT